MSLTNNQIYALYELENWWYHKTNLKFNLSGPYGTGKLQIVRYFIDRNNLDFNSVVFLTLSDTTVFRLSKMKINVKQIHNFLFDAIESDNDSVRYTFEYKLKEKTKKKIELFVLIDTDMIDDTLFLQIASFKKPMIVLTDTNLFINTSSIPKYMDNPNYYINEISSENSTSPITWLANRIVSGDELKKGVYGNSSIIKRKTLDEYMLAHCDVVLTKTRDLRKNMNDLFRDTVLSYARTHSLHKNEKLICMSDALFKLDKNGNALRRYTIGKIADKNEDDYRAPTIKILFESSINKKFKNVLLDRGYLFTGKETSAAKKACNFEFAYALTMDRCLGNVFRSTIILNEDSNNSDEHKRWLYKAITKSTQQVIIVT